MTRWDIDTDKDSENDEAFRLLVIGEAVLSEAKTHPAFGEWLWEFLDRRIEDENDRALFQLGQRRKSRPDLVPAPPVTD